MNYFKVVRKNLMSYAQGDRGNIYPVQYKLREFVKPVVDGTKLFVFDTLQNAENFIIRSALSYDEFDIYVCQVINAENCLAIGCPYGVTQAAINRFWNAKTPSEKYLAGKIPPSGTTQCDEVCLLAKVDWRNEE